LLLSAYRAAGLHRLTAHATPFTGSVERDYSEYFVSQQLLDERARIRTALQTSGLAQLIPCGLDGLPDITEAVPEMLRPFVRLQMPQRYSDLPRHVARNLDWYLDPARGTVGWHRLLSPGFLFVVAFLMQAMLLPLLLMFATPGVSELLAVLVIYFPFIAITCLSIAQFRNQARDQLNALELYLYLRSCFREDGAEPGAPAGASGREQ
jgi:hypothetical protein